MKRTDYCHRGEDDGSNRNNGKSGNDFKFNRLPPDHKLNKFPKNFERTPGVSATLVNPGNVANLHKLTRDIMPIYTEGVQLSYKRTFATNEMILCNWVLSQIKPAGFRIGRIYNSQYQWNILETPTIAADINPSSFATNFSLLYHPVPAIRFECNAQIEPFPYCCRQPASDFRIGVECIESSATTTLNLYRTRAAAGHLTLAYLKSVTNRLSVGGEMLLEWNNGAIYVQPSLAARYGWSEYAAAATISPRAIDISLWRQTRKNFQIGTSFVCTKSNMIKPLGSVFYQCEFPNAVIRSSIDSDLSVGFTYTRNLKNMCCNFGLSILCCIPANRFVCGFKFDIEQPPLSRTPPAPAPAAVLPLTPSTADMKQP